MTREMIQVRVCDCIPVNGEEAELLANGLSEEYARIVIRTGIPMAKINTTCTTLDFRTLELQALFGGSQGIVFNKDTYDEKYYNAIMTSLAFNDEMIITFTLNQAKAM